MKKNIIEDIDEQPDYAADLLEMERKARSLGSTNQPMPKFEIGQYVEFAAPPDLFAERSVVKKGQIVKFIGGDYVLALPDGKTATAKECQII